MQTNDYQQLYDKVKQSLVNKFNNKQFKYDYDFEMSKLSKLSKVGSVYGGPLNYSKYNFYVSDAKNPIVVDKETGEVSNLNGLTIDIITTQKQSMIDFINNDFISFFGRCSNLADFELILDIPEDESAFNYIDVKVFKDIIIDMFKRAGAMSYKEVIDRCNSISDYQTFIDTINNFVTAMCSIPELKIYYPSKFISYSIFLDSLGKLEEDDLKEIVDDLEKFSKSIGYNFSIDTQDFAIDDDISTVNEDYSFEDGDLDLLLLEFIEAVKHLANNFTSYVDKITNVKSLYYLYRVMSFDTFPKSDLDMNNPKSRQIVLNLIKDSMYFYLADESMHLTKNKFIDDVRFLKLIDFKKISNYDRIIYDINYVFENVTSNGGTSDEFKRFCIYLQSVIIRYSVKANYLFKIDDEYIGLINL